MGDKCKFCSIFRSCHDDSMILCEPKIPKVRRDPYERSLAELRLFPDRNPSAMNSAGYPRLGNFITSYLVFSSNYNCCPIASFRSAWSNWCWCMEIRQRLETRSIRCYNDGLFKNLGLFTLV